MSPESLDQSLGRSRAVSATGLRKVFTVPWSVVFTSSFPANVALTLAMGQQLWAVSLSLSRTRSPT